MIPELQFFNRFNFSYLVFSIFPVIEHGTPNRHGLVYPSNRHGSYIIGGSIEERKEMTKLYEQLLAAKKELEKEIEESKKNHE